MHYLSPTVHAYFLWREHVVNRDQQNFGGFICVGSNCSYFSDNNSNDNSNSNNNNNNNENNNNNNNNSYISFNIFLETINFLY